MARPELTKAEQMVADLNTLRARLAEIESGMRDIRLGAKVQMEYKRFFWRPMVIAFGWSTMVREPLPKGIERDFYDFLHERAGKLGREINELTRQVDALAPDKPVC
jgi:hypothetical protein